MLATAAIIKLKITPGPAMFLATMPATRYMPVPQQDPTPSDVKSSVVKHFCEEKSVNNNWNWLGRINIITVSLGFLLRGSSPCSFCSDFVLINLEKSVTPVPQAGAGMENFIALNQGVLGVVLEISGVSVAQLKVQWDSINSVQFV